MRLPDPARSRAILIGTTDYQRLPDLPAVRANLRDLAAALTDPDLGGFAPEHCVVLANPTSVREVYRALREQTKAQDTVLVYFAGHGLISSGKGELHLALSDTDPDEVRVSALAFDVVREVLRESPAANRVLVLDCCFSGRALPEAMGTVVGQVEVTGTYTLAATPPNAVALAPKGHTHTAFTGELLHVLTHGVANDSELLGLDDIYRAVHSRMSAHGYPLPGSAGSHNAGLLALARNPVHHPRPLPPVAERHRFPWGTVVVAAALGIATAFAGWFAYESFTPDPFDALHAPTSSSSTPTSAPAKPVAATTTTTPTAPTSVTEKPVIKVYNNSSVPGLGAKAAEDIGDLGYDVAPGGNYSGGTIPMTTVYFRAGDQHERELAEKVATDLGARCKSRFDEVEDDLPGVLVIVTNDYHSPEKLPAGETRPPVTCD
ncbi:caspase, EACC1-associated type [Actinokineospora globicatena]|uniref:Caspase domain-containing protein n=1 Tax=Actinokineospora globicatena TaxID=103729 RepID=A0A9W6QN52_9PSEU|nr:caspase family protein [Actinokineospora globicatena]GLW92805.1 hypothetical protein Aglo03_36210 [Actinokineospora globicatena]